MRTPSEASLVGVHCNQQDSQEHLEYTYNSQSTLVGGDNSRPSAIMSFLTTLTVLHY